jgi:Gluconate 2-dehydrogenase subunit 3
MSMNFGLNRRDLLQRAALLVGAAALPGGADALAAAVKAGARQLDAGRYAVLVALADTIVPKTDTPGALDANVPPQVDALIGTWASPERRTLLTGAIDAIDKAARDKHQRGFAALTPAEREAVLTPYDAAALKPAPVTPPPTIPVGAAPTTVDPHYGRPKQEPAQSMMDRYSPRFADPAYGKLKELIVVLYYYSEAALTHDLAYEHAPGEWRPSIPLTPTTRPWGGTGMT